MMNSQIPWWWCCIDDSEGTPPDADISADSAEEILNKLIKFFKDKALAVDEEFLGTDDFIRAIEIDRTNIRCISTSILTICGFLLPILFGIFYFIVKDSSNLHVQIPLILILALIGSIVILFIAIYFSVQGIRAPKLAPAELLLTKLDKLTYLKGIRANEITSSERSIWFLGGSVVLVLITFIGIYYCIATTPNGINETVNATAINISLR
jgi:hypothetical protein